jgi:hypothetical protein
LDPSDEAAHLALMLPAQLGGRRTGADAELAPVPNVDESPRERDAPPASAFRSTACAGDRPDSCREGS